MADPEDQQVWRASIGLDLADRPVLEAEVLIWRIVRQMSTTLPRGDQVGIQRSDSV